MSLLKEMAEAINMVLPPKRTETEHAKLRAAVLKEIVTRGVSHVRCGGYVYKVTAVKVGE